MKDHKSGQALIEYALLLPLYGVLIVGILAFGQWFVIQQEMISVVREGALLYSSGRIEAGEVASMMRQSFLHSYPALNVPLQQITVGRSHDSQARNYQLDEVRVTYSPTLLMTRFKFVKLEESCVIKHAPSYRVLWMPIFPSDPPVPW